MPEKIMFVDDELTVNPRMLDKIFGSILTPNEITQLENLESSPMGTDIEDIREALKDNPFLEVFDSFEDALVRIYKSRENIIFEFELFVFDRNLGSSAGGTGGYIKYDINRIKEISEINFTEDYSKQGVEGDFLAEVLLSLINESDLFPRLYFYSAYADKKTQISAKLKSRHEENHCIDKSNPEKLCKIIENRKLISVRVLYRNEILFFDPILKELEKKDKVPSNQNLTDKLLQFLSIDEKAKQTDVDIGFLRNILLELILYAYNNGKNYFHPKAKDTTKDPTPTADLMKQAAQEAKDIPPLLGRMKQGKLRQPGVFPNFIAGLFWSVNNALSTDGHSSVSLPKCTFMVIKFSILNIVAWLDNEFNS